MDRVAVRAAINEARASLHLAVKIDPGRRAMEGDIESAHLRLDEAREALDLGNISWARQAVAEALGLLSSEESRQIAEDHEVLETAIRQLGEIDWG